MSSKIIAITLALSTTIAMQCSEVNSAITIRPATSNDLDAILQFNKDCFKKDFTPIVAQTITTKKTVDCFIDKLIIRHECFCQDSITKQLNQKPYGILVAHRTSVETETPIIGYCRFFQKNTHTIQIGFLGVNESYRRQGIAKHLAFAAMSHFNGITECIFRAFSNYDFIKEIYSKHDCKITGSVLFNPDTEDFSTDPTNSNELIPFNDYLYTIKK